jgi:hypothetical protein
MAEIEKLRCVHHNGDPIKTSNFYIANDSSIFKGIRYIPICKRCLFKMANDYYDNYKDMEITIYLMCMQTDIAFDKGIYRGALKKNEDDAAKVFQSYIVQYNSLGSTNKIQLSFLEGEHIFGLNTNEIDANQNKINNNTEDINKNIEIFWGKGFEFDDYDFLEIELENWKKTHKCDNQAEITLLKEICIKILEIRKKREKGQGVGREQKELQDLMKTASVDPAKANAISDGQTVDRFGVWIKDIEQYRPAEWWDKQEKYVDMDGFKPYIQNYIVRPIKNFFTGVKNFIIGDEDLSLEEDENE